MRSLLEIKTPIRSIARSYILTTPESSNIGILEVNTCLSVCSPACGGCNNTHLWLALLLPGWLGLAEEDSCWPDHDSYKSKHPDSLQPGKTTESLLKYMLARSIIDVDVWIDMTKLLWGTLLRNTKTLTFRVCVSVCLSAFSSPAEGDAPWEFEPVSGSLPGLGDLCPGGGTLPSGKFGRPASWRRHETGLDVQVFVAHGPH